MFRQADHTNEAPVRREVTVRLAGAADSNALRHLASLDSAPAPSGAIVLAEAGGEIVAALPILGGRAIADPFRRTAALIEMLELRAGQLRSQLPAPRAGSGSARIGGLVRHARGRRLAGAPR